MGGTFGEGGTGGTGSTASKGSMGGTGGRGGTGGKWGWGGNYLLLDFLFENFHSFFLHKLIHLENLTIFVQNQE